MMRVVFSAVLVLFVACKSAPEVKEEGPEPSIPAQDMQVLTQTLTDCSVKLTGTIEATEDALAVQKAVFEFVVDGAVLKSGEQALNVAVAAGQKSDFSIEQSFTYVKDAEELKAMDTRGGSLLLALRGNVVATITQTGEDGKTTTKTIELPFARSREVRTPRLPHVKLVDYEAGRFSESEMQAVFHVGVVNPNPFQIALNELTYEVSLAGKKVSEGRQGAGERVSPSSTGVFDVTATMNEETHGKDVKKLIKALNVPYSLTGEMKTALYSEPLTNQGTIKLNASKE